MNYHLNNLVNKTKTIVLFNSQIITSENYMKTEKIITDAGSIIYGGATNIQFLADTTSVLSGYFYPSGLLVSLQILKAETLDTEEPIGFSLAGACERLQIFLIK